MRLWRWIIGLLLVAAIAACGWHWVAEDPGYVVAGLRGYTVTTSVVAAVVMLLLAWAVLGVVWRLLRWPFGALSRRHRRLSQQRLSAGLIAMAEGRHADAERDLTRAARYQPLRGAALLGAAEAAGRRGEPTRAFEALDQAAQESPRAARVLRARMLRLDGRAGEAISLLAADADTQSLTPSGWVELAEAALVTGDMRRARQALEPLQKSGALSGRLFGDLETRVLLASIARSADGASLSTFWTQMPKAQRRSAVVVDAYARRAAGYGQHLAAMDEIESALRREWSPLLAGTYGTLGIDDIETRLRRAEGWLDAHPNDAALLTALGRMCVRLKLWGKARAYLERALALESTPAAWEALGDCCVGQGDVSLAQRCYRNALASARGEMVEPLPEVRSSRIDTRPVAVEERDAHGVPRLPK